MNKVYVIELDGKPRQVFLDKREAHEVAERMFGSKQDGICVDNVCVVAYVPVQV